MNYAKLIELQKKNWDLEQVRKFSKLLKLGSLLIIGF
jgi:hypothetical protein